MSSAGEKTVLESKIKNIDQQISILQELKETAAKKNNKLYTIFFILINFRMD